MKKNFINRITEIILFSLLILKLASSPSIALNAFKTQERNIDGSIIIIKSTDCNQNMICFELTLKNTGEKVKHKIMSHKNKKPAEVELIDIDKDGFYDLIIRGVCGAGPNCKGDIFRFDSSKRNLYHFYSGGYYDLEVSKGYVIETGRSNYNTWVYNVYKIPSDQALITYKNVEFYIESTVKTKNVSSFCRFKLPNGKVIKPPNKQWLKYCSMQDNKYILKLPKNFRDLK